MEQFIITKEWIMNNRTKRGAWTKKQIEALGLKWPATQGWINDLVGDVISSHDARSFEEGKDKIKKAKKPVQPNIDKYIEYLFKNAHKLSPQQIVRLRNVESKYKDSRL